MKITGNVRPRSRSYSFKEIYDKRKHILIKRDRGGLGDILMHRMIFEDFKLLMPDVKITFACPKIYHPAVQDHPFIDFVEDCKTVDEDQFIVKYNTTGACRRYELMKAPFADKHRSDIWAEHCGVKLTRHDMNIKLTDEEKEYARSQLDVGKETVLIAPISAMIAKNLEEHQCQPVIDELEGRGYHVVVIHDLPTSFRARSIVDATLRQWMALINQADYIISVDTAAFHCAGGMGKKVVAVFGWADGLVYSKHYPNVSLVQKHRNYTPGWTCGPCYNFGDCVKTKGDVTRKPCITEITAEDILNGFEKVK